jgi:hypothetical protein
MTCFHVLDPDPERMIRIRIQFPKIMPVSTAVIRELADSFAII